MGRLLKRIKKKVKKAVKKVEKVQVPEVIKRKKVLKPEEWNTSWTGQDQLNFLADNFSEVKKFLEQ